ncbi:sigma-70 family RNA polymerase sigma factor [Psychrobacillus vulpis]|uniref:Sigma-70 family RNA polymerase sigma factor n=2 Tax=Psychrobacillus vulpis TaxID=2325572 RepID=A0A544TIQ3_9BACI|nr:sigma-70 family RNA polymerase sigma factor [Psychrobacillus vulpis]
MHEGIVQDIKKGNRDAFRNLYDEYAGYAIRTAKAITRNDELAKDAVQEAFIRVYRNISSYDPKLSFSAWFYRILVNECNRLLNKEKKMVPTDTSLMENTSQLIERSKESVADIYGIIQHMADLYRIPLLLKYIKGFSEKEIAEILNLNQNTVKSRLFNGRKLLRNQLNWRENEYGPNGRTS